MLDRHTALSWMDAFTNTIEENKTHLSKLDNPIGDGDHGHNMSRGVKAASEALNSTPPKTLSEVFKTVAMSLISKVGGAAGPLYGTAFLNMSKYIGDNETLSKEQIASMLEEGLNGIKTRGKATTGEKTMIDLWEPAVNHFKENGTLDASIIDDYVEKTNPMKATKGRAAYLGERSIGHTDPGATSSGLLFKTLIDTAGLS